MGLVKGEYIIYPVGCVLSQEKLCLTVGNNSTKPCAGIVLKNMEIDNQAQQFMIEKNKNHYAIKAVHSNLVLDVFEWREDSGTKIIQYNSHDGANQLWDILELSAEEIEMFANFIPGGKELLKDKHIYVIKSVLVKDFGLDIVDGVLVNSDTPCSFVFEKV